VFDINTVFAGILVLTAFALALDAVVGVIEKRLLVWRPSAARPSAVSSRRAQVQAGRLPNSIFWTWSCGFARITARTCSQTSAPRLRSPQSAFWLRH